MPLPRMYRLRQKFSTPRLEDIPGEIVRQLKRLNLGHRVKPGQSVAVTVGSRGIANIAVITKGIVDHLRGLGVQPFIVPAMGSHGGGTPEGQREVIESYGVTEEFVGCPIRSSMETVIVAQTPHGIPVHFDRFAWEADHVVVAGRIKPHTGFVGEVESGLHKMMLIGLGKHAGAQTYHQAIKDHSFGEIVRAVADVVLERCKVLCGIGIVENAQDETALIEGVAPKDFYEREKALLLKAREWLPRLPFRQCDLLIIDRIGKDISGTGMDTNIIGRKYNDHVATDRDDTNCRRIFVRSLTEKTHGNATGIGIAEFANRRTIDAVDYQATRVNCMTAGHPTGAMLPVWYDTDREVIEAALNTVGLTPPERAKVMQITDTLHLEELLVSEAYVDESRGIETLDLFGDPEPMRFDEAGNLQDVTG